MNDKYRLIQRLTGEYLAKKNEFIRLTEQFVKMASPEYILQKGYTLTLKDGKILKSVSGLAEGDKVVTRFADGETEAVVSSITKTKQ